MLVVLVTNACVYQAQDIDALFGDGDLSTMTDDGPLTDDGDGGPGGGDDPTGGDGVSCAASCAPCPVGSKPQLGDGSCCGTCVETRDTCPAPPSKCASDADCDGGRTCVLSVGLCGVQSATDDLVDFGGANRCAPDQCWSNPTFFSFDCCPSCFVSCGSLGDSCEIYFCGGASCSCQAGFACTASACICSG